MLPERERERERERGREREAEDPLLLHPPPPATPEAAVLGEPAAHGSSPLGSQVQRLVLLALVEFPEVFFLSLVNDGEDTGDGFADDSYLGELGRGAACHLGDAKLG